MSIEVTRRELFASALGFPALAAAAVTDPLSAKKPHFRATAQSVIFLFMHGGPSHLETFDPKPELNKLDGKPVPPASGQCSSSSRSSMISRCSVAGASSSNTGSRESRFPICSRTSPGCIDDIAVDPLDVPRRLHTYRRAELAE